MENVILIILLLLALGLIAVVLLQRSEGGGLGMGGGGGAVSGRSAATALTRLTWILGAGFMAASLVMTIIAAQKSAGSSVLDRTNAPAETAGAPATPAVPAADDLLPPSQGDNAPLVPSLD